MRVGLKIRMKRMEEIKKNVEKECLKQGLSDEKRKYANVKYKNIKKALHIEITDNEIEIIIFK